MRRPNEPPHRELPMHRASRRLILRASRTACRGLTRLARALVLFLFLVTPSVAQEGADRGGERRVDNGLDSARAWRHLETLVALGERPSGTIPNAKARAYIADELRKLGLDPFTQSFEAPTPIGVITYNNVYVDIPPTAESGAPSSAPIVILATHFDTKLLEFEFVGANDGGSGTALLLELARCLLARERRTVTYRVLFLDGEEALRPYWAGEDNCYGSRHHVKELGKDGTLARVRACVLLDMVGDAELVLAMEGYSDARLVDLFFGAARRLGLGAHLGKKPHDIKDDHLRFLDAGIPSVDLIDFEYGPSNEFWHTGADRLDKCSAKSLEIVGRIVLEGLPELEAFATGASGAAR